jgi:plasmid stabilization system protein ParE
MSVYQSGSVDTAIRVLENITGRFWLLAQQPYMGRRREDLSSDLRSFAVENHVILYSIKNDEGVLIHYVFPRLRGRRGSHGRLKGLLQRR